MRTFANFAVVDWSGEAVARPKGLAVAFATADRRAPVPLRPDRGWSRQDILDWLRRLADDEIDILVGLDLSPALPYVDCGSFFPGWSKSPNTAEELWHLVDELSENDEHLSVRPLLNHSEVRRHFRQVNDRGDLYPDGRGRLRVCERRQLTSGLSPTSCLNLVGASQVGKSSLTGMRVLSRLGGRVPLWPMQEVPAKGPVLVEIYTAVAAVAAARSKSRSKVRSGEDLDTALANLGSEGHRRLSKYDDHTTDAIITAAWLRNVAPCQALWKPEGLTPELARTEGWTFGIV